MCPLNIEYQYGHSTGTMAKCVDTGTGSSARDGPESNEAHLPSPLPQHQVSGGALYQNDINELQLRRTLTEHSALVETVCT